MVDITGGGKKDKNPKNPKKGKGDGKKSSTNAKRKPKSGQRTKKEEVEEEEGLDDDEDDDYEENEEFEKYLLEVVDKEPSSKPDRSNLLKQMEKKKEREAAKAKKMKKLMAQTISATEQKPKGKEETHGVEEVEFPEEDEDTATVEFVQDVEDKDNKGTATVEFMQDAEDKDQEEDEIEEEEGEKEPNKEDTVQETENKLCESEIGDGKRQEKRRSFPFPDGRIVVVDKNLPREIEMQQLAPGSEKSRGEVSNEPGGIDDSVSTSKVDEGEIPSREDKRADKEYNKEETAVDDTTLIGENKSERSSEEPLHSEESTSQKEEVPEAELTGEGSRPSQAVVMENRKQDTEECEKEDSSKSDCQKEEPQLQDSSKTAAEIYRMENLAELQVGVDELKNKELTGQKSHPERPGRHTSRKKKISPKRLSPKNIPNKECEGDEALLSSNNKKKKKTEKDKSGDPDFVPATSLELEVSDNRRQSGRIKSRETQESTIEESTVKTDISEEKDEDDIPLAHFQHQKSEANDDDDMPLLHYKYNLKKCSVSLSPAKVGMGSFASVTESGVETGRKSNAEEKSDVEHQSSQNKTEGRKKSAVGRKRVKTKAEKKEMDQIEWFTHLMLATQQRDEEEKQKWLEDSSTAGLYGEADAPDYDDEDYIVHIPEERRECTICGKVIYELQEYVDHVTTHNEFYCSVCEAQFVDEEEYGHHCQEAHGVLRREQVGDKNVSDTTFLEDSESTQDLSKGHLSVMESRHILETPLPDQEKESRHMEQTQEDTHVTETFTSGTGVAEDIMEIDESLLQPALVEALVQVSDTTNQEIKDFRLRTIVEDAGSSLENSPDKKSGTKDSPPTVKGKSGTQDSPRTVKGKRGTQDSPHTLKTKAEVAKYLSDLSIEYSKVDINDLPALSEETDMGDLTPYAESSPEKKAPFSARHDTSEEAEYISSVSKEYEQVAIKELLAEDSESGIDENTFSEEKNSECEKSEGIGKEEVTENIVEKMESDSEREKKRDGEISTDSEEQQKTGVTAADSGAECEMKSGTRESPVTDDTSDKVSYAVVMESEAESDQKMDTQSLDLQASGGSSIQKDGGDGKEELQCSRSSEIEINKSTESPVTDDKSDKGSDAFVTDSPHAVKGESGTEVAKCLSDLSIEYSKVDIKDLPSLSEDTDMGDLTPYTESEAESDQKMDTQCTDQEDAQSYSDQVKLK